jgi:hypothetical protein
VKGLSRRFFDPNKSLTNIDVTSELTKMYPCIKISEHNIRGYLREYQQLKCDLMKYSGDRIRKTMLNYAIELRMTNGKGNTVCTFAEIGKEFNVKPNWETAEQLFHVLYTSIEKTVDFVGELEKSFMTTNGIHYENANSLVADEDTSQETVSGIRKCIVAKLNDVRKLIKQKSSYRNGYYVTKSKERLKNGKQAKRRRVGVFEKCFVKRISNYSSAFKNHIQVHNNELPFEASIFDDDDDGKGNSIMEETTARKINCEKRSSAKVLNKTHFDNESVLAKENIEAFNHDKETFIKAKELQAKEKTQAARKEVRKFNKLENGSAAGEIENVKNLINVLTNKSCIIFFLKKEY